MSDDNCIIFVPRTLETLMHLIGEKRELAAALERIATASKASKKFSESLVTIFAALFEIYRTTQTCSTVRIIINAVTDNIERISDVDCTVLHTSSGRRLYQQYKVYEALCHALQGNSCAETEVRRRMLSAPEAWMNITSAATNKRTCMRCSGRKRVYMHRSIN